MRDDPVICKGPEHYDKNAVALNQVVKYKGKLLQGKRRNIMSNLSPGSNRPYSNKTYPNGATITVRNNSSTTQGNYTLQISGQQASVPQTINTQTTNPPHNNVTKISNTGTVGLDVNP